MRRRRRIVGAIALALGVPVIAAGLAAVAAGEHRVASNRLTTITEAPTTSSVPTVGWHPVAPATTVPEQSPVQQQYDKGFEAGFSSASDKAAFDRSEAVALPGPAIGGGWPDLVVSDTPGGWATEFVSGLLDIDFARQSRYALGAWLAAESAPDLMPGVPGALADRALYVSVLDPYIIDLPSVLPSLGQWQADAAAGVRWSASDLEVQLEPAWQQMVDAGWQPPDVRAAVEDVSGVLTVTRGRTSATGRFSVVVQVGSARWRVRDTGPCSSRTGRCRAMACEWYNPATYGQCAGGVAKAAAGDAFSVIAHSFGDAADHAVNWLWSQMSAATAVHLGGAGFNVELDITAAIAGVVALGLFAIQIIQSVLRREPGGLARALKGLVVAFLGGGAAIAAVDLLLGATDSLCAGVVRAATGTDITGLGKLILGPSVLTAAVGGSAALLLLSLACIAATVVVYVALVIRKVLIVVTAVFAPLAFAGSLADITVSWTRRWIETTVALIVSKLFLILIFVVGYGILIEGVGQAGSGATQKVTQVISGILVLFLAGFAPWSALKIVHFTGEHANHLHSLGASSVGGVAAGGRMAQKAAPYLSRSAVPATAGVGSIGTSAFAGKPAASGLPVTGPGGPSGRNGTSRWSESESGSKEKTASTQVHTAQGGPRTSPSCAAAPAVRQQSRPPGDARPGSSPVAPPAESTP